MNYIIKGGDYYDHEDDYIPDYWNIMIRKMIPSDLKKIEKFDKYIGIEYIAKLYDAYIIDNNKMLHSKIDQFIKKRIHSNDNDSLRDAVGIILYYLFVINNYEWDINKLAIPKKFPIKYLKIGLQLTQQSINKINKQIKEKENTGYKNPKERLKALKDENNFFKKQFKN
jgi:hypothetical protein